MKASVAFILVLGCGGNGASTTSEVTTAGPVTTSTSSATTGGSGLDSTTGPSECTFVFGFCECGGFPQDPEDVDGECLCGDVEIPYFPNCTPTFCMLNELGQCECNMGDPSGFPQWSGDAGGCRCSGTPVQPVTVGNTCLCGEGVDIGNARCCAFVPASGCVCDNPAFGAERIDGQCICGVEVIDASFCV